MREQFFLSANSPPRPSLGAGRQRLAKGHRAATGHGFDIQSAGVRNIDDKKRHLFLSTMHPEQNFKLWYYALLKDYFGEDVSFMDILDFYNDEKSAIEIEIDSFKSDVFLQYFFCQNLLDVNKKYLSRLRRSDSRYIYFLADSHFRPFIFPETVFRLRENDHVTIGYLGDCYERAPLNRLWLTVFDWIRTIHPEGLEAYRAHKKNLVWQRLGADDRLLALSTVEKQHDVIFVGRPYGNRATVLKRIVRDIPGVRLALFGAKEWKRHRLLRPYYRGYLSNENFHREIGKAKVSLALLEGPDGKTPHYTAKVFDSAAPGTAVLATHYPILEQHHVLKDGDAIVYYRDEAELIVKLKGLLENDARRRAIADRFHAVMSSQRMKDRILAVPRAVAGGENPPWRRPPDSGIIKGLSPHEARSLPDEDIRCHAYVYLVEGQRADAYLDHLITEWDKAGFLADINIADGAFPHLVLNYKVPVTTRCLFYRADFFCRNRVALLSRNPLRRLAVIYGHRSRAILLRMILFHGESLTPWEKFLFHGMNVGRRAKGVWRRTLGAW